MYGYVLVVAKGVVAYGHVQAGFQHLATPILWKALHFWRDRVGMLACTRSDPVCSVPPP